MSDSDEQYEDEFTRLVEGELDGDVYDEDEQQRELFEDVYEYDLENSPPVVSLLGWTVASNIGCKYRFDLVLVAMVAAIQKFCPGHTDIKQVPFAGLCMDELNLFQCKNAEGDDQLFIFDVREHGYDMDYLSMIGPLDLNETGLLISGKDTIEDQLHGMESMGLIELFNELSRIQMEYMLELDHRSDLMAVSTESLLDLDKGLGSIGADNLALVSRMLMRM
jgi:hypothetical protein